MEKLCIGSRNSPLAIAQVKEVIQLLGDTNIEFEIKTYDTSGDIDKNTPISQVEGTDFFTDTLESALLKNEIDIAVHSAKDLPDVIPSGLEIVCITETIDPYDVLVSKNNLKLDELPRKAKIATSSNRRKEQLKKYRPDFQIVDIRGNIEERLLKLNNSDIDAIVIASAGLIRLGLEKRITQKIPFDIIQPHPLQGSLAIETKYNNFEIIKMFNKLDTRKKILFICIENSCRSQIAESLMNHLYWQPTRGGFALSAGSKPSGVVNPFAIEVMKEKKIDISYQKSKSFDDIKNIQFDYVITMGCGDVCPSFVQRATSNVQRFDWQIPDPKNKSIEFFRQVRDELETKIKGGLKNV